MRLSLIFSVLALTALIFYSAVQSFSGMGSSSVSASVSAELENATAQAEIDRAAFDEEVAVLNKAIEDLRAETAAQSASLEATLAERSELQSQLDAANQKSSEFEADYANAIAEKDELTQELAALASDLEGRELATRDVEATSQDLNNKIEEGRVEIQSLQATIADLEQQSGELAQQLAERDAIAAKAAQTEDELAEAKVALEQNATALQEAEERIARLTDMVTTQVQTASELTSEVEEFEALLTTLTVETSVLSDEVAKRDTVIAGLLSRTDAPTTSPVASCQERSDAVLSVAQISFDAGTTKITAESVPLIEQLAAIASDCVQDDLVLEIEGHTDNAGGAASNLLLSDGRAKAVRDLLSASGVPVSSMRAVGFGGSEPIADNNTSDGQSQNQRVVLDWEQS